MKNILLVHSGLLHEKTVIVVKVVQHLGMKKNLNIRPTITELLLLYLSCCKCCCMELDLLLSIAMNHTTPPLFSLLVCCSSTPVVIISNEESGLWVKGQVGGRGEQRINVFTFYWNNGIYNSHYTFLVNFIIIIIGLSPLLLLLYMTHGQEYLYFLLVFLSWS